MSVLDYLMLIRPQIAGSLVTLFVAISFFAVKRKRDFVHMLFTWMIVIQITMLVFHAISIWTVNNRSAVPPWLNDLVHIIFLSSLCLFLCVMFLYVRFLITNDKSWKIMTLYTIPIAGAVSIILFTPIEYIEIEHTGYSSGLAVTIIFGIAAVYIVGMLYMLIRYRKAISGEKLRILLMALLGEISVSLIEFFIPSILLSSFGTSMVMLAIYLTIENPDRILRDMYENAYKKSEEHLRIISESINYASKIQKNLLPRGYAMSLAFADFSAIWEPRDVVGGDIYWLRRYETGTVLCVADCTGHGTPGALLTILVTSALESIVRHDNCRDTAGIVFKLDQKLFSVLNMSADFENRRGILDIYDGCDIAVLFIAADGSVRYSSGKIPLFVCDGAVVTHHKGQRIFVGEGKLSDKSEVAVIDIPANPANKYYIASDGMYDQAGGEQGMLYGHKMFKRILLENHSEKLSVITGKVWDDYERYRGNEARRDDFELIAFRP